MKIFKNNNIHFIPKPTCDKKQYKLTECTYFHNRLLMLIAYMAGHSFTKNINVLYVYVFGTNHWFTNLYGVSYVLPMICFSVNDMLQEICSSMKFYTENKFIGTISGYNKVQQRWQSGHNST